MKKLCVNCGRDDHQCCRGCWCHPAFGLFILRLVVGLIFLSHGVMKWQNLPGTLDFFTSLGFLPFWAYVVATVETAGGLSLILGLFSRLFGVLLAGVMVVAILTVKWPLGGWAASELELLLLASTLAISLIGPSRWALGKKW